MHKHLLAMASFLIVLAAASASPALAKWGCAARGPSNSWGNSLAANSEAEAREAALKTCANGYAKANGGKVIACHIIGCNSNIDTPEQTLATWPAPTRITVKCGPRYGNQC